MNVLHLVSVAYWPLAKFTLGQQHNVLLTLCLGATFPLSMFSTSVLCQADLLLEVISAIVILLHHKLQTKWTAIISIESILLQQAVQTLYFLLYKPRNYTQVDLKMDP